MNTIRIAIVANLSWNFFNYRMELARLLKHAGYEPILIAATDKYAIRLVAEGWRFVPLKNMKRTGVNPLNDILLFFELKKLYKSLDIKCVLHFHSKALVYGNFAASLLGIPFLPTIAGLGGPFSDDRKWVTKVVTLLYKLAFRGCNKAIFQNQEDIAFFHSAGILSKTKAVLIEGSGVDLKRYDINNFKRKETKKFTFLLFARLTRSKGIEYYVEAAREISKRFKGIECKLAGTFESDRLAFDKTEVESWHNEGFINFIGVATDVAMELSNCDVVVLPTVYREGLPKSLLEAAAMSKPIIATDNVGCRQVVEHGVNGLLVKSKDVEALVEAFETLYLLPKTERLAMGARSRKIAEQRFDEEIINQQYLTVIEGLMRS